jgi:hypothetical protein
MVADMHVFLPGILLSKLQETLLVSTRQARPNGTVPDVIYRITIKICGGFV